MKVHLHLSAGDGYSCAGYQRGETVSSADVLLIWFQLNAQVLEALTRVTCMVVRSVTSCKVSLGSRCMLVMTTP
eukprot:scaffold7688_cov28-Prasinocladus_malaysianus.AAC.1